MREEGNFWQNPVASSFWLVLARLVLWRCLRSTVSRSCLIGIARRLVGQPALLVELLRGLADQAPSFGLICAGALAAEL
jgi:hypothetical protein